jgi:uncharacterized protein
MQKELLAKYDNLRKWLSAYKGLAIAFSGGVDSSLLLGIAAAEIGRTHVLALTGKSRAIPKEELKTAKQFTARLKVRHKILVVENIRIINSYKNSPRRCYYCKKEIFSRFLQYAQNRGFDTLIEGSHLEDETDYRPGLKALQELAILSPLKLCGFTKDDIRTLSRFLGIPNHDKPSSPCLVSRFPYGIKITEHALRQVEQAERYLRTLDFRLVRVRNYDHKACLEFDKKAIPRAMALKGKIQKRLSHLGFSEIYIEPLGYKQGGMNKF